MKKLILICMICFMCLNGCAKESEVTAETEIIKLTIWHYYGGTAEETFSYLVQNFNQTVGAENNIVVEAYSYDGVSALAEAVDAAAYGMAGAGAMPSIFATYVDSVLPLDEQGLIANLDDYFTEEELNCYHESFVEEGRLGDNNELKILPIAKSTEVLHVNKTAYDTFSLETGYTYEDLQTWEGIAEVSEAYYKWTDELTAEENDGSAFFGTDGMANFMIIGTKQLGNDIFVENDKGEITYQFTEEIAQKMWDVFYVPYMQGYYSAEASYRSDDVASGEIIAYIGSTASSYYFPSGITTDEGEYVEIECIAMTYPVFEEGDAVVVQQGAGMAVSKSTEEEEAAASLFLKWFTDSDNNCGFAVSTGYMPVKNEVLNEAYILTEMGRDGAVDETLPIVQATKATYEQLDTYTLYTSIPFIGSEDARTILEDSFLSKVQIDQEELELRVASGEEYDAVIQEMISQENFATWYNGICEQLDLVIN